MAIIAIILIFGGIGYSIEAIIAGCIRYFLPRPLRRGRSRTGNHHYLRNGLLAIFAGIIIMTLF